MKRLFPSVKGNTYNFTEAHKIKLKPKNFMFIPLSKPKFDVVLMSHGMIVRKGTITNEELSRIPITGISVIKCHKGTVIEKVEDGL